MIISVDVDIQDQEPIKRACSLLEECVIEPGDKHDYKSLARWHYRNTGMPPAIHQIYRARHAPSGESVGAIVYAAPALNLGIRNKIFGDRFKIGGKRGTSSLRAARLNRELELIIRVVVHPTFRGTGLGVSLIRDTLRERPYRFIEMSAAMGSLNPFGERAGMKGVVVPRPKNTEQVLAALKSIGMTEKQMGNPAEIVRVVRSLPADRQKWLEDRLIKYATGWIKARTNREIRMNLEIAADRVASNALLKTVYYIWDRDAASST